MLGGAEKLDEDDLIGGEHHLGDDVGTGLFLRSSTDILLVLVGHCVSVEPQRLPGERFLLR